MEEKDLAALRRDIDTLDDAIAALFVSRMDAVRAVKAYKRARGLPVRDAGREAAILERVEKQVGAEDAAGARALFDLLFSLSRDAQERD